MMKLLATALCAALAAPVLASKGDDDCASAPFDQCGGIGFDGDTCCPAGYECDYANDYYSGCNLEDLCLVVQFGQCGGVDEDGQAWPDDQKCCPDGFACEEQSEYYSQCVEAGVNTTDCSGAYEQCGGNNWDGPTCCTSGYECTVDSEWYSGCTLIPVCTNPAYGQCGGTDSDGNDWTDKHDTCCPDGFECSYQSEYFSQCLSIYDKPKPKDDMCTTDADCNALIATAKCVVESEYYSACVDCASDSFDSQCKYWSGTFLEAAEDTCEIATCDGRCPGGDDAECADSSTGSTCISSDSYDACMDCSNQTVFDSECFGLSDDNLKLAQDTCGLSCTNRCPGHTDDECPDDTKCVVQADQQFEQCVSCEVDDFQSACPYWSDQIRDAAEATCGLTCDDAAVIKRH